MFRHKPFRPIYNNPHMNRRRDFNRNRRWVRPRVLGHLTRIQPILPSGFTYDSDNFIEIYIHGSIISEKLPFGKFQDIVSFGIWFGPSHPMNRVQVLSHTGRETIFAAIIQASEQTLILAKSLIGYHKVKIVTCMHFLSDNIKLWYQKYDRRNLLSKLKPDIIVGHRAIQESLLAQQKKEVLSWQENKYKEEIQRLCQAMEGNIIKWEVVKRNHSKLMEVMNLMKLIPKVRQLSNK